MRITVARQQTKGSFGPAETRSGVRPPESLDRPPGTAGRLLNLQESHGNRFVRHMVQTKLSAGQYLLRQGLGNPSQAPTTCKPPPCPDPPPGFQQEDPRIASGGLCRGACGADCDSDACTVQAPLVRCISDPTGSCHRTCIYTLQECGSHPGCVAHDDCYDRCAATLGEMGFCNPITGANPCHCACDQDCASVYGYWTCGRWAFGHGPQPNRISFTGTPVDGGVIPGACLTP